MLDVLGGPETYNHYPTGWAFGVLGPVPHVQALLVPGRRLRPDGDPLAQGHRGQGRGPPPVPPRHRRRADDPRGVRARVARVRQRLRADADRRRLDAVLLRRRTDAPDGQADPVLRHARHPRHLARRVEGGRRARADLGDRALRPGPLAAVPHRRRPRRGPRPRRPSTPRSCRSSIDVWFAEAEKYDVLPLDDRTPLEILLAERPSTLRGQGPVRLLPGHHRAARSARRRTSGAARSRSSPRSRSPTPTPTACSFAHGSRFGGHSLFVKDRKLFYVNSFIGVPPEQQFVGEGVTVGKRVLGMEFVKESVGDRHETHGTTKLYIDDQRRRRGADAHPTRPLRPVRRGPDDRPRLGRPGQRRVRPAVPVHRRPDPPGRGLPRRATSTSTSRPKPPP